MSINVIGAGLAGCEAAWQIAKRGEKVNLYEMKPYKFSPAHKEKTFAELVCSNSLKAKRLESAAGLLKEEMRYFGSILVECAYACEVPAGGALAVDREKFSKLVTKKKNHLKTSKVALYQLLKWQKWILCQLQFVVLQATLFYHLPNT